VFRFEQTSSRLHAKK